MYNRSFSLVTYAGIFLLAVACSGDNPAGPGAPGQVTPNAPVSNAIKSDLAASAGNAIASDLEEMVANQVAAIGSFALAAPSSSAFSDGTAAPAPQPEHHDSVPATSPTPAPEHHDSTPATEPQHNDSNPPASEPQPEHHDSAAAPAPAPAPAVSESCSFDAASLVYSCVKVGDSRKVVKSYQFL